MLHQLINIVSRMQLNNVQLPIFILVVLLNQWRVVTTEVTPQGNLNASTIYQEQNPQSTLTCGQVCEYEQWLEKANCNSRRLKEVPQSSGCEDARLLELQENNLIVLSSSRFSGFNHVRTLDVSDNAILMLEPGSFSAMIKLTNIFLNRNQLMELRDRSFMGTEHALKRLYLNSNLVTYIEKGTFKGLIKLQTLHLCHNEIEIVPPTIFQSLSTLRHLMLCNNQIQYLNRHTFNGLTTLETLSLNGNNLRQLPDGLFSGLKSLKEVFLHDNKLLTMPYPGDLFTAKQLQLIDLRDNVINESSYVLPYLGMSSNFRLGGNPFCCDCDFSIMQEWYLNNTIAENLENSIGCEFNGSFFYINENLPVNCQYFELKRRANSSLQVTLKTYNPVSERSHTIRYLPLLCNENSEAKEMSLILPVSVTALLTAVLIICTLFLCIRTGNKDNG